MFDRDRKFIENKYHKTDEPFNPYARMAYHGYDYDKSTGLEDEEIRDGLAKLYEKIKTLPHKMFFSVSSAAVFIPGEGGWTCETEKSML